MAVDLDAGLIQRCQAGDREAFAGLVERYQRPLYGLAYRLVNDRSEAEDVAQEAFLRAFRSLAGFRAGEPFAPWLYRIATNIALDRLRKRRREGVAPSEEEAAMVADAGPGPEETAIEHDSHGRLAAAIAALPVEYRLPVILFHMRGQPIDEVARITSLPVTVVKNRLYRARKMLREMMHEPHPETASRRCSDEQLSVREPVGSLR